MAELNVDITRLADVCRQYRVSRLDVFGSVARGDDSTDSDIDVLYELEPGARIGWEIEDLSIALSEIFGRPVDLVSRRSLHHLIRDDVLAKAKPLYAA